MMHGAYNVKFIILSATCCKLPFNSLQSDGTIVATSHTPISYFFQPTNAQFYKLSHTY